MKRRETSLGVDWTLPGKKRRFATSTKATSDLIVYMSESGCTVMEAAEQINYDEEAKNILLYLCRHGYRHTKLSELVA